jgi:HD-like signal output (HDOD) protein
MCAKLLQLVNSAFFGLPQRIVNPGEAVFYLGIDTIKALVLTLQFFAFFERVRLPEFSFPRLWSHCWTTGLLAREIARAESMEARALDQTFIAGLLHDSGKLVLATGLPTQYGSALKWQANLPGPIWKYEKDIFGTTHAEVGAYLLALWGLPDPIIEAVAWHHAPAESFNLRLSPLAVVHVADVLGQEMDPPDPRTAALDEGFLTQAALLDRLPAWRELARQLRRQVE